MRVLTKKVNLKIFLVYLEIVFYNLYYDVSSLPHENIKTHTYPYSFPFVPPKQRPLGSAAGYGILETNPCKI